MQESGLNIALFRLINDAHNPVLDGFFGIVSGFGDGLVIALLCALIMLFRLRLGLAAMLAFITSGLLAQFLKRLFDMPRPPALLENVHVLGAPLTSHSFPSGHSASDGVMLLAAFLLWNVRDLRAWGVAALFALAAIGRIYGGVHFPLDVTVGLVLGALCMHGFWRWSAGWPVDRWQASAWSWRFCILLVAVLAAVLGLGYHMQPLTAQPLAVVLPVAALLILGRRWKEIIGGGRG
ncbi:MAG: phosphoesterase [Zetaproteobacteria bacterium CG06_land_8_20_14_3_00_59_53]|nr:MAG: phosphoesterase [Zetaproteobacteria bacterium CG2_30_59_37]PIO90920.1 MAG: phosphoesterase [Zetaproteobacteria bacterium CG23_combo_of_CG06-09_8_20_14_all_59_86]PIQ64110.1 MAG: phosphoesterase [Zetaproteobacteria bacterium CG11_big_fil_rev_8_21_14_0_20_59_439]PIU71102.1 MAG: phosphoesterase [Zetaproteobacteria bacterium CG06_land_8_20_14_3_00_59_53]PIU96095.1 MAG: phosphoesterase [Zetaproteobacteria bacterium CG03_land_8_20_14_0_80_59_51]PIY46356.1 MAG: phosphoesterase [Zetaproteobacte